jgi:hypothetical protein
MKYVSRHHTPYRGPTRFWKYLNANREARTKWSSKAAVRRSGSTTVTGAQDAPAIFDVVFGGRSRA